VPIEVLYFADLKDITQKNKESFEIPDLNMKELIGLLFKKYESFKFLLWDEHLKNIRNDVSIAVNDSITHSNDKLSISFSNGDKIAFLLPISGG